MSTIYSRLGIDTTKLANNVQQLSSSANSYINLVPPMLESWQITDMATNNSNGYFKNPVTEIANTVASTANTILVMCSPVPELNAITEAATTMVAAKEYFIGHTNRMSNVEQISPKTSVLPHYDTAIIVSKSVMTLVGQTDGVQNNAPMLACFTSIMTGNTLTQKSNTLLTYPSVIQHSINVWTDDSLNTYYSSNLSPTIIAEVVSLMNDVESIYVDYPAADVATYNTYRTIQSEVNTHRLLSSRGQTEEHLIQNLIGTDKLKTRLNS